MSFGDDTFCSAAFGCLARHRTSERTRPRFLLSFPVSD